MADGFKRQNQTIERLEKEKEKMAQHIHLLQERMIILHFVITQTQPLQIEEHPKEQKSSPSQFKMNKKGVHSPKNVEKATVSARGTTSPVQTVAGKNLPIPLMADTLPKKVISENPNPKPKTAKTEDSGSNEYNRSQEQFAQDPNEDDDLRMSFDSIALHNLDT
ncbi:hypothetical protein H5410_005722 [Solanum commersonii]|uniref:Uncharacterized protein n=1 Tax=Solanum commersonii TaxID=4109 RepID=A0A9J6A7X8_SOLCO|nr:hypothetical protein H5410_005722 [Solanum commersonii]